MLKSIVLSSSNDVCGLSNDGDFKVKDIRIFLDDLILPHSEPTRWIKAMPIKINIFAWRARKDCLPTRMNLVQRDINIDSVLCPVCVTNDEDAHHLFFDAIWHNMCYVDYVVGGTSTHMVGLRSMISSLGFLRSDASEKEHNRELKDDMVIAIPNVKDDGEFLHTTRVEYECEPPTCGVSMVFGHDDMLCPKRPIEKPKKQHINHDGIQHPSSSHGTDVGSKINELESQMIEGKLVLLGDDEKHLKPCKPPPPSSSNVVSKKVDDLINEDSDSEVEEVYNETVTYMASTSSKVNKASKSGSGGGK
nr:RNA-directed DNA polymerase, eukaryota [Tanacetum cinerariifolium]